MTMENLNKVLSKKSGITTLIVAMLWELSGKYPQYVLHFGYMMVGIAIVYMLLDFFKNLGKIKENKEV